MSKIFPPMFSRPKTGTLFAIAACWPWVFVLLPMWMPFMGMGLWETPSYIAWLEIGYHVVNGVLMICVLGTYLKDEWIMVTTDPKFYLRHTAVAVGLMVAVTIVLVCGLAFAGLNVDNMLNGLPVVEMSVSLTSSYLATINPIFGTASMVIFSPFSVCGLIYALSFAPVCTNRPSLAYMTMAVVTLIPVLIDILWRGETALVMGIYLVQLPLHMVACWSYQKTDNAWTPIWSLALWNLLSALASGLIF